MLDFGLQVGDDEPWVLAMAKPRALGEALDQLGRQGYRTLAPEAVFEDGVRPAFGRYLFVGVSAGLALGPVFHTLGVATVVSFGELPVEVPVRVITRLFLRLDVDGRIDCRKPKVEAMRFKVGDDVEVRDGPLAGFRAVVVGLGLDRDQRIRLWLDAFGRTTDVVVPASHVVPTHHSDRRGKQWKRDKAASPGLR